MLKEVLTLLNSGEFQSSLTKINKNYSNLKQESVIRNSILELLNEKFLDKHQRAFAEHPREGSKRIDLSIYDQVKKESYCIEFKFQYTNDFGKFVNYQGLIDSDFNRIIREGIKCDLFILIVARWNPKEKEDYDLKWGTHSAKQSLSRYLSNDDVWKDNLKKLFNSYNLIAEFTTIDLYVTEPYKTEYFFHIMNRS